MKKNITSALLLLSLAITTQAAVNLIDNPSFEDLKADGLPAKWNANKPENSPEVKHSADTADATLGKYAAVISNSSEKYGVSDFLAYIQNINTEKLTPYIPNQTMKLTFDYCTDAPATAIRAYIEGSAMGQGFSFMGPTATRYVGWGKYELKFKLPPEKPGNIYLVIQLLNSGSVRLDNVVLSATDDAPTAAPEPEVKSVPKNIKLTVDFPNLPSRNTYILPKKPGKIQVSAKMGKEKFNYLYLSLTDTGNKVLKKWRLNALGNAVNDVIELPDLAPGIYQLESSASIMGKKFTDKTSFRVAPADSKFKVKFNADNIMLLNNKPFFMIAACPPFVSDEALQAYQLAGFNTITPQINASNTPELANFFYNHAAKYNLNVIEWINFADSAGQSEADLAERVKSAMENTKNFPNFIGWMNDEDAWRGITIDSVRKVYEAFWNNAPGNILWCNQAPRGSQQLLTEYGKFCDVTGADVYPIPDSSKHSEMPNRTIGCIDDYTDDFIETVNNRKPVWMILQAWSWAGKKATLDKPLPNYGELRFMFYNAITHGATGIAWFDNFTLDPANPAFKDLASINLEFAKIVDFITQGKNGDFVSSTDELSQVKLYDRIFDGKKLAIVVNESPYDKKVELKFNDGTNFFILGKTEKTAINNQKLTLNLKPFEVVILVSFPCTVTVPDSFPQLKEMPEVSLEKALTLPAIAKIKWRGNWIWNSKLMDNKSFSVTTALQTINLSKKVTSAYLAVSADNAYDLSVNGKKLGSGSVLNIAQSYNIAPYLVKGENKIEVKITNYGSYGGTVFEGKINYTDQTSDLIISGESTRFYDEATGKATVKPYIFGPPPITPWGEIQVSPLAK